MNRWLIALATLLLATVVLVEASPWWHDKYFGVAGNESTAVSTLRNINALENQYMAKHLNDGFICELKQLHESGVREFNDSPTDWLVGEESGYRFTLTGCMPDANGIVNRYEATAIPAKLQSTGVRAFCTDQSGTLFYDLKGSPSQCFASRKQLPD